MMEMEVESDKRQIRTLRALTGCDKIATADSFLVSLASRYQNFLTKLCRFPLIPLLNTKALVINAIC